MRCLLDMDTIQIEVTNHCVRTCSNCTRFCGHHKHPYFMSLEQVEQALQSMEGFPKMVGIMGGEPLLHPEFEEVCKLALKYFKRKQLGLWTGLPKGFERYREIICETFDHILLNDHSREDIFHQPLLVAADEVMEVERELFYLVDHCWVQNSWSACINPNGSFFCEVAGAWAMLNGNKGWPVEKGWWWRTPKDFKEQIETYCRGCGGALPIRRRTSNEIVDDVSPKTLEFLKAIESPKVLKGQYVVHDLKTIKRTDQERLAAYKEGDFRQQIAQRYGMYLLQNDKGYQTPYLIKSNVLPAESLFERYRREYDEQTGKTAVGA